MHSKMREKNMEHANTVIAKTAEKLRLGFSCVTVFCTVEKVAFSAGNLLWVTTDLATCADAARNDSDEVVWDRCVGDPAKTT